MSASRTQLLTCLLADLPDLLPALEAAGLDCAGTVSAAPIPRFMPRPRQKVG
jgi:hypothetical protein